MATAQIASSEVGNLYTALFLWLYCQHLQAAFNNGDEIDGNKLALLLMVVVQPTKVFEAKINSSWKM